MRDLSGVVLSASDASEVSDSEETYAEMATGHFQKLRDAWNELDTKGDSEAAEALLAQLFQYFIERQRDPESNDNLHLKNALYAIVRNKDPRFHVALSKFFMEQETNDDPERIQMVMLATEFDAVRKRRLGHKIRTREESPDQPGGMLLIDEARKTFKTVFQYWEEVGDLESQGRTIYELGQIETSLEKWEHAASWHEKSAEVADEAGDHVGAHIGIVKQTEALLHVDDSDFASIESAMFKSLTELKKLAEAGNTTAKAWVIVATGHRAEACLKLAQEAQAKSDAGARMQWSSETIVLCNSILNDEFGYRAELKTEDPKIPAQVEAIKADAKAIHAAN
jgi:hypothetical protein